MPRTNSIKSLAFRVLRERVARRLELESCPTRNVQAGQTAGQASPPVKLFRFIGRKVRTPAGVGTLLQVFQDRVTVVLDAELSKCSCFAPGEIEPANWSL